MEWQGNSRAHDSGCCLYKKDDDGNNDDSNGEGESDVDGKSDKDKDNNKVDNDDNIDDGHHNDKDSNNKIRNRMESRTHGVILVKTKEDGRKSWAPNKTNTASLIKYWERNLDRFFTQKMMNDSSSGGFVFDLLSQPNQTQR